ncbi:hypothetical protein PAECIP111891_01445 [Paenibacillus allorhizoplanae]|uniref:DUF4183 domain-containing protein n=1 Tax=Paenibacillus allorhizoplanae TaxID=2905648 RepID=A0ABM9SFF0_9BACL|nr:DUF4183 domain-containing protein [Paenibacillus allorhizoplanae]CAH1199993.1 hypothetical protein PAECIP111891_01445 [Paenibacillus allorhizoplanae]
MSEHLITLHLTATSVVTGSITTTTTTTLTPSVKRFTANVVLGNILGGVTTILSSSFRDDTGANLPANSLTVPGSNGYYNVFVNGALLLGYLTTLSTASLVINTGLTIGVTVNLETLSFTAASSSTSTTNNLVVTTTIHTN